MNSTSTRYFFKLSLLKIPVVNLQRAVSFYRDTLGFEENFAADEYGWAQLSAGDLTLALFVPGMGGGDGSVGASVGFHLSLPGAEFDELADAVQSAGVLVEDRVHKGNDGTTFIDIRDPDGNVLKVMRTG